MSYTKEDLTNIDAAISEMAMGQRVGEVVCAGRRIKYADVSLAQLEALRSRIARSFNKPKRFSQLVSDKGLY